MMTEHELNALENESALIVTDELVRQQYISNAVYVNRSHKRELGL